MFLTSGNDGVAAAVDVVSEQEVRFLNVLCFIGSLPGPSVQRGGEESGFQIHQDPDGDQHRLPAL